MAKSIYRINHAAQMGRWSPRNAHQPQHQRWNTLVQRTLWTDSRTVPKIAQQSTWNSIIPKIFRQRSENKVSLEPKAKKPPNPATYVIIISLLIGSQAIRIIQAQNEFQTYMRKADVQIGKLREVVDALLRGEEVDIEKALGAGDEAQELDWEEALRELEKEDRTWQARAQEKRDGEQGEKETNGSEEGASGDDASPINQDQSTADPEPELELSSGRKNPTLSGFY